MIEIPERVAHRAFARFEVDELTGCHVSRYSVGSHGYAQVQWGQNGKHNATTAHRAAWVHIKGQIPPDMTVDHLCRNRRCVNVNHLRLLSNFENSRRNARDWPLGECGNGHPNSALITLGGRVRCGICLDEQRARAFEQGKSNEMVCGAEDCWRPAGNSHGGRRGMCQTHAKKGANFKIRSYARKKAEAA